MSRQHRVVTKNRRRQARLKRLKAKSKAARLDAAKKKKAK